MWCFGGALAIRSLIEDSIGDQVGHEGGVKDEEGRNSGLRTSGGAVRGVAVSGEDLGGEKGMADFGGWIWVGGDVFGDWDSGGGLGSSRCVGTDGLVGLGSGGSKGFGILC